jgi:CHAD domain-containing protein
MKLHFGKLTIPTKRIIEEAVQELAKSLRKLVADLQRAKTARTYDPELTHRLRVGSRRTTAALNLLRHAGCTLNDKKLRRQLKRLRRDIGPLRDADVRWAHYLEALPKSAGPGWSFLAGAIRHAHHEAHHAWQESRDKLAASVSKAADDLLDDIKNHRKAWLDKSRPKRVKRWLEREYTDWRSLAEKAPPAEFHRVRIAGKKVRYLLELVFPKKAPAEAALEPLRRFLSCLGSLRDTQLLIDFITSLTLAVATPKAPAAWKTALIIWRRRLDRELQHAHRDCPGLRDHLP